MGEAIQLRSQRGHQPRVAMACVEHGDAGSKVDIALALDIPDFAVLGAVGVEIAHHTYPRGVAASLRRTSSAFFIDWLQ
jgi:hypothetical protein